MPRLIRTEKRHPNGSLRAVWESYRIDDADGAVRIWTPVGAIVNHVNGRWVREFASLSVWKPGDPYVAAVWEEDALELYIDIVREVVVTDSSFAYTDLYVDVMHREGRTWSKDEELAERLDPPERQRAFAIRDDLLRAVSAGDPPFHLHHLRWNVPDEVRSLPPGVELALRESAERGRLAAHRDAL